MKTSSFAVFTSSAIADKLSGEMIDYPFDRRAILVAFAALCVCVGCSNGDRPPIGQVTGVVTVDGKPMAGLGILFSQKGFRSSSGFTNERGEYELKYVKDTMGAAVGSHKVRIEYISQEGAGPRRGRIPAQYNRNTELTVEVEPGNNEFNFDVKTN
ncbi:MAG: hypothetical protein AAGD11_02490 [Planctomycetota bacterium]